VSERLRVSISVDGRPVDVPPGTSVAVALLQEGVYRFRTSVRGEPRGPVCGMGTCFECRVTIDGRPHQRACLVACEAGMAIATSRGPDA
jgi:D-hydroxyproline dehydrogenase subunit gamma